MEAVLIHPLSGLLSAYGIGRAMVSASRQQALVEPLGPESLAAIDRLAADLRAAAAADLSEQGVDPDAGRRRHPPSPALCRNRHHPARCMDRRCPRHAGRVRDRSQGAVRFRQSGQDGDGRDRRGRNHRGGKRDGCKPKPPRPPRAMRPRTGRCRFFCGGRTVQAAVLPARRRWFPATGYAAPRSSSSRTRPSWSNPAGRRN